MSRGSAWIPNRFPSHCAADTVAVYRDLGDSTVEVLNRCQGAEARPYTLR